MRDLETGSLWSHILGRCMDGELEGETLSFVPGTVTTWSDWLTRYPDTTVLDLSRTSFDYQRLAFSDPANFVIGIKIGLKIKAYTYAYLSQHPIVQEEVAGTPIVIAFDPESTRAYVYDRTLDGGAVLFDDKYEDGYLIDLDTGSHWDPWSGRALSGDRQGEVLAAQYGIISYRRAWTTFYPNSEMVDLAAPAEGGEEAP